ncbi:3-(3-hydroxy-phenyl)propionate transporter MhpT [Luteimonas sp. RIT-PG2_3]
MAIQSAMGTTADGQQRRSWLTVAMCCLVAVFEGFDLQAAGVAAPKLIPVFGLDPAQLGWFFSASTFGLMLGAVFGGRLSDRFGRKRVLIASVAVFGLLSVLTALSTTVDHLLITRFLTGVGLGGALPNLIALVAENTPARHRNLVVGMLYAGLPAGGALAALTSLAGAHPESWTAVFYVGGLAPLALTIPLMLFLPESRAIERVQRSDTATARQGFATALFSEGRLAPTLLLWVGFFLALLTMYLLLNWLPSLLIERGLARGDASWVQMAFNVGGVIASIAVGKLMDGSRRGLTIIATFSATVVALAALSSVPTVFALLLLVGAAVGATVSGTQTILYAMAPSAYPARVRGTGVGSAVSVGRLGSAAGPILAAVLLGSGQSGTQVILTLAPIILVAGVVTLVLMKYTVARDE